MKALREVRPPGVYPIGSESRLTPITVADAHIAGFVGLASKGPLDVPIRLQNWTDFVDIFGASSEGYLARAVEGFFQNGGKTCYVVRIAKLPRPGAALGPEHAASAQRELRDAWDKPTLLVTALNEGRWGNNIWVKCAVSAVEPGTDGTQGGTGAKGNRVTRTILVMDLSVGDGAARVKSTRGFEKGALLRISDRQGNADHVILTRVDDKMLYWGTDTPIVRPYSASEIVSLDVVEFELHASLRDRREVFKNLQLSPLSRRYAPRVVNEQSQLVRLVDLRSPSPLPHSLPPASPAEKLTGGRDGTDVLTEQDFIGRDGGIDDRTGLWALAYEEDVGLLLCPDAMLVYNRVAWAPNPDKPDQVSQERARVFVERIQDVMLDICERNQDQFAILDLPKVREIEDVRGRRFRRDSAFGACYFPWIEVPLSDGGAMVMPPSGHVAGVYARCDLQHGVHKAPANEPLHGVTQLTLSLSDDHIGQLNSDGVNCLRQFTGRGIRIWGARTINDINDADWRYVNVRRLFIMLRRALTRGTEWVAFEPNTPDTWSLLGREISLFLRNLWTRGYFSGGSEEDSFLVKCDAETNPPEGVDSGRLVTEIRIAPAVPAEYILFTLEQQMGEQAQTAA